MQMIRCAYVHVMKKCIHVQELKLRHTWHRRQRRSSTYMVCAFAYACAADKGMQCKAVRCDRAEDGCVRL